MMNKLMINNYLKWDHKYQCQLNLLKKHLKREVIILEEEKEVENNKVIEIINKKRIYKISKIGKILMIENHKKKVEEGKNSEDKNIKIKYKIIIYNFNY